MFITFEGPNGVGKTTIVGGVGNRLLAEGFNVVNTKEPTMSLLGEFLRNAEESCSGECLACLAAADRYFHIERELIPALSIGKIILSDRYIESSLVLQGMDGCAFDFVWELNSRVLIPDLSVILIAEASILNDRLLTRQQLSRFERDKPREQEVCLYREAAKFISQHGFNVVLLENDIVLPEENISRIVQEIQKLHKKKKEVRS